VTFIFIDSLTSLWEVAMRCRWIRCAVLLVVLGLAKEAFAERRPEERSEATHVILGTVAGVYMREKGDTRYYLVDIAIEKVERGEGFQPGGTFYVECYLWTPDYYKGKKLTPEEEKQLVFRGAPYGGVPREGERVRVYAKDQTRYATGRRGKYDGIYPDWYEVVKGK
jgi:hypothetical protein